MEILPLLAGIIQQTCPT